MPFDGTVVEPVKAAELSCAKSPTRVRPTEARGTSLRMPLRARGRDVFLPPDQAQDGEEQKGRCDEDQQGSHLACVSVEEDVARKRNAERHAPDLAVQPERPGIPSRARVTARA